MGVREAVQPAFNLIWGTVHKNVEAMPDEGFDFKPQGLETRPFREIAIHMANSCMTFGENIGRSARCGGAAEESGEHWFGSIADRSETTRSCDAHPRG